MILQDSKFASKVGHPSEPAVNFRNRTAPGATRWQSVTHSQHRKGLSTRMVALVNVCAVLFTVVLFWASAPGHAETKSPKFLGQILSASAATYFVLTDANVRGKPLTKSRRVGRMRKGIRVQAAGKAKGTTGSRSARKERIGVSFCRGAGPRIDGSISAPLSGRLAVDDLPEEYNIRYEGRHPVDGDVQVISDYAVALSCDFRAKNWHLRPPCF